MAVVVFVGRQADSNTAEDEQREATLLWVASLVQILGLGLVKSAVTLTVLKLAIRSWHRSTLVTYLCRFGSSAPISNVLTLSRHHRAPDYLLVWVNTALRRAHNRILGHSGRATYNLQAHRPHQQCTGRYRYCLGRATSTSTPLDLASYKTTYHPTPVSIYPCNSSHRMWKCTYLFRSQCMADFTCFCHQDLHALHIHRIVSQPLVP